MNLATLLVLTITLTACSTAPRPAPVDAAPAAPAAAPTRDRATAPAPPVLPAGAALDLSTALRLARANAPELAAITHQLQAQTEMLGVAGRLPDPEFSVGFEALPFSAPRSGEEILAGIRQPLPLSGRLAGREDLEKARLRELRVRQQRIAAEVDARLRGTFATALSLQEAASIQAARLEIARQAESLASARVAQGDLTPDAVTTIQADRVRTERELRELRSRSDSARGELFALMSIPATGAPLEGTLEAVLDLPLFAALADRIESIPMVAESMAQAEVAAFGAELAAARTIPMVNLDLFYRQRGDNRDSFDFGVSFEVPLSGAAAAESRAARSLAAAASQRSKLQLRESLIELRKRHADVARALESVSDYEHHLLPASAAALAVAQARLQAGDLSPVDVLPLQDRHARVELARLDAWHRLLTSWAALSPFLPTE